MKRYMIIVYNDQGIIARSFDILQDVLDRRLDALEMGLQAQLYELKLIDDEHPEAGLKYVFME